MKQPLVIASRILCVEEASVQNPSPMAGDAIIHRTAGLLAAADLLPLFRCDIYRVVYPRELRHICGDLAQTDLDGQMGRVR